MPEPHTKGSSLLGLGAALGFYFFFFLETLGFPLVFHKQGGEILVMMLFFSIPQSQWFCQKFLLSSQVQRIC